MVISGCIGLAPKNEHEIYAKEINHQNYQCKNDTIIHATYYSLSDNSLGFVKLTLPDNHEVTLAQAISASGARYSNGLLTWWIKGSSGFFQSQNQSNNCQSQLNPP